MENAEEDGFLLIIGCRFWQFELKYSSGTGTYCYEK